MASSSVSFGDLLEQFANTEEDPAAVAVAIGPGGGSSKGTGKGTGKGGSDSAFRQSRLRMPALVLSVVMR